MKDLNKILKFFPFMPEKEDSGKLVLAIIFYVFVPPIISMIIGFILGLTIILSPLAIVVGLVASVYTVAGIVFAVMSYMGKEIDLENKSNNDK